MTLKRFILGLGIFVACIAATQVVAELVPAEAAFDAHDATEVFLGSVSAEAETNTNGYVDAGYQIMVIAVVVDIILALVLLRFGFAKKWREIAERITRRKFLQAFIYMPIYLAVTMVILAPLSWYQGYYVEQKFGLSNHTLVSWLIEFAQSSVISLIVFTLFIALFYLIVRASPTRWWIWGSGLVVSFFAFLMFLGPLVIDPIFNEYKPMDEGPLKDRIISLARANGMEADDVKQVDQSKQKTRVSANVSGIFGSSRIALDDNLLIRAKPSAVEAVMGHEIGHYILNHQWKTMAYFALIFLVGFALVSGIFGVIVRRHGEAWGVRGIDDYAGFPLLYAIAMVFFFVTTPLFNKLTYVHEAKADIFAINATQNPDAWAEVALLTAEYRKLRPPQWEEKWLNHHPSPYARIYMAKQWKAEHPELITKVSSTVEPSAGEDSG